MSLSSSRWMNRPQKGVDLHQREEDGIFTSPQWIFTSTGLHQRENNIERMFTSPRRIFTSTNLHLATLTDRPPPRWIDLQLSASTFVSKWLGLGFVGAGWNGCRWVKLWLICCWFGFFFFFVFVFVFDLFISIWFVYFYLICFVEIVADLFIDLWFDFGCDFGWFRVKLLRWVWWIGGEVVAMGLLGRKLICRLCWCWLCWINMLAMGFGLSWICVLMSWMGWLCQMCYCHEWVGERKNNI